MSVHKYPPLTAIFVAAAAVRVWIWTEHNTRGYKLALRRAAAAALLGIKWLVRSVGGRVEVEGRAADKIRLTLISHYVLPAVGKLREQEDWIFITAKDNKFAASSSSHTAEVQE